LKGPSPDIPAAPSSKPAAPRWLDEPASGQPRRPTELTHGLLNALDRPPVPSITPSTFGTVIAGMLTAGLFPAIMLPRAWRRTMRWHQNILWHLAEWMTVNVGSEEGQRLHALAVAPLANLLNRLATLAAIAAAAAGVLAVMNGTPLLALWVAVPWESSTGAWAGLCTTAMSASFVLSWLSVNLHLRWLHRARIAMNALTPHLPATRGMRIPAWESGIRIVPLALGALLAISGMLWTLPMLIAATAQRRAVIGHHRQLRAQLAHRVRDLQASRRPLVALPAVIDRVGMCRNAGCDQALAPHARYCPRCGTGQRPLGRILE
jgi:hypothetical protein